MVRPVECTNLGTQHPNGHSSAGGDGNVMLNEHFVSLVEQ